MWWFCFCAKVPRITAGVSNFSLHTRKMRVEKIYFLYLHFHMSENLGPLSGVLYTRYKSFLQFP